MLEKYTQRVVLIVSIPTCLRRLCDDSAKEHIVDESRVTAQDVVDVERPRA